MKKICNRKDCEKAGEDQPKENFYKRQLNKDGLHDTCIKCLRKVANEKNRERKKDREAYSIL